MKRINNEAEMKHMAKSTGRNGIIELMRFVFAMGVLLYHLCRTTHKGAVVLASSGALDFTLFGNGFIGVDFFFILSGLFMARSIYKKYQIVIEGGEATSPIHYGEDTIRFVWRKIKSLLPYYIPICILTFVLKICMDSKYGFQDFLSQLPSVFFLDRTGISYNDLISGAWYLSSMFIVMLILYPICVRYYRVFTVLIAPVVGLLSVGFLIHTYQVIGSGLNWVYIVSGANIRALASICLGTCCFEISRRMQKKTFPVWARALLSALALFGYGIALLYSCSTMDSRFSGEAVLFLCVSITISFSRKGLLGAGNWHSNNLFLYLGALSLPIYLSQNLFRKTISKWFPGLDPWTQMLMMVIGTLLFSIIMHEIIRIVRRIRKKA